MINRVVIMRNEFEPKRSILSEKVIAMKGEEIRVVLTST
jgi:hypothetical protein